MELTYTKVGDYYIPALTLGDQPDKALGKYGRMRQKILEEHHHGTYPTFAGRAVSLCLCGWYLSAAELG